MNSLSFSNYLPNNGLFIREEMSVASFSKLFAEKIWYLNGTMPAGTRTNLAYMPHVFFWCTLFGNILMHYTFDPGDGTRPVLYQTQHN